MAVLKYYDTTDSTWKYIAASTTANFTTWKKTATGGETSVSGTDDNAVTLSYTVGLEQVFINGVLQVRGSDYTATNGTSVTGLTALVAGDIVTVVCYAPFNIANTVAPTLVDAKGDLIAGTAADTVGRLAVGANGTILTAASGETTGLKWSGTYASWTPTFTNLTIGNGTLSGSYIQIGKMVHAWFNLSFGSTTSITGAVQVTGLPVAPVSNAAAVNAIVQANYSDATGNKWWGTSHANNNNTTRIWLSPMTVSGSYLRSDADLSSTVPFTWTTNDVLSMGIVYEGA